MYVCVYIYIYIHNMFTELSKGEGSNKSPPACRTAPVREPPSAHRRRLAGHLA